MYVAKEEPEVSDHHIQVTVKLGQKFPLTSASFGKCYLAFIEEGKMNEIIKKVKFKQLTDKSITDFETFQASLIEARRKGYAVSFEDHTPGVFGVSAPIFDYSSSITMVIACIGVASNMSEDQITFCGDKLKVAARRIMEALGGKEPISLSPHIQ